MTTPTPSEGSIAADMRRAGLRITAPRRAIISALAEDPEAHLSAADVWEAARRSDPGIDQSTVYRTLETLEDLGVLRHVHFGHGPGVYHLANDASPHHHLVCETCGRSEDVSLSDIEPLLESVAARHGFVSAGLHFALSGTCAHCAAD